MTFTIKQLATLGGVTPRTLRHYDELNLLTPAFINDSGYRIYTQKEVDRLQTILFYRELDFSLEQIKDILAQDINQVTLLEQQRLALVEKRNRLTNLIATLDQTIASEKGDLLMTNEEKFQHFKDSHLQENERTYGEEIRQKYGNEAVEKANSIFKNRTQDEYDEWMKLEQDLLERLTHHLELSIPSEESDCIYTLHKKWLTLSWGDYSKAKHHGLAQMYLITPEFTEYYDSRCGTGATQFLVETITFYTQN